MGGAEVLFLVLFAVAFWLLLVRPQRRRQQAMLETQRAVRPGDEVMTHAGFFGRVTAELEDPAAGDCLLLEVAPGTEIKIARGAVLRVLTDDDALPEPPHEPPTDPTDDHPRSN